VFKTDPRVYQYALDRLGLRRARSRSCRRTVGTPMRRRISARRRLVQSLPPARERLPGAPDFEISNLAELPPRLGVR